MELNAPTSFRIDARDYATVMARAPKRLQANLTKAIKGFGTYFLDKFTRERLSKKGVQPPGGGLGVRSGMLRRRFDQRVLPSDGSRLEHVIFSPTIYAAIHEFGGIVRAKRARYLTIPLHAAMTRTGVLRAGARAWPNTFVFTSRKGNKFIAQRSSGKKGGLKLLFLLREQVHLPPRMGLRDMMKRELPTRDKFLMAGIVATLRTLDKP